MEQHKTDITIESIRRAADEISLDGRGSLFDLEPHLALDPPTMPCRMPRKRARARTH